MPPVFKEGKDKKMESDCRNSSAPLVDLKEITKTFPGVLANNDINLHLSSGEVLALLGENGAGKSSLMNILCGLYRPDSGEIHIRCEKVEINSPRDAANLCIGMVHQNFMLVETMTVAENIVLGLSDLPFLPDFKEIKNRIKELSNLYNLYVNVDDYIWQLSVGEQQKVEILKLLYRDVDILILDEPTAVLTPQESQDLNKVIKRLKQEGKGAIFITHKMDEVFSFADRVMVLRRGELVADKSISETNPKELANLMVGREILFRLEKKNASPGKEILKLCEVSCLDNRGLPALRSLSLNIRSGEILGIAGVAGNGQTELAEVITGLRRIKTGSLLINSLDISNCQPLTIIKSGVSHIPEDRISQGVVGDLSVAHNLAMKTYRDKPLTLAGILNPSRILERARVLIESFKIKTPSPLTRVKFLSGGNIQKTILAREIDSCKSLLIAAYPSRGLDVGATEGVRKELLSQRDQGKAVLLISEDLEELISVADRIAVLFNGEIVGEIPSSEASVERLGLLMTGVKE